MLFFLLYLKDKKSKKHLYLSYFSLGLAFLAKGPVVLIFFLGPVLAFGLFQKEKTALKGLLFLPGWLIFAVLAISWYLYALVHLGAEPFESVIRLDIVQKTVGKSNKDPFYGYFLRLFASFLPWVLIMVYKTKTQIKSLFSNYETSYFSYAFFVPLMIMSLISEKHGKYILPLFPAFAVFLGVWLSSCWADLKVWWEAKANGRLAWAVASVLVCYFLFYSVVEPRIYRYRYESLGPIVAKLQQLPEKTRIYSFARVPNRVVYYYGRPIPVVLKDKINEMISQEQSFALIVESRDWWALEDLNLPILMEYEPYLKHDRAVRILAPPNLASAGAAKKKEG
jgi:4-amino-4-deoxy-L-arabinose transferase-like glycosyltransferase